MTTPLLFDKNEQLNPVTRPANRCLLLPVVATLMAVTSAFAEEPARATYLANEGVLVTSGDSKILFDPLFDNAFGQYQLLPKNMEDALFAGEPPFDGIDAVFVSHAHGDHFAPSMMLDYLRARPEVRLYAPMQAVTAMRRTGDDNSPIFNRVVGLAIDTGDEPVTIELNDIAISAARIPHSGWPNRMTDIENIAFRVTLDDDVTIVHMGDADASIEHFRSHSDYWQRQSADLALPPYWFFLSDEGTTILDEALNAKMSVGVHVPEEMPDDPSARPAELRGYDLFTEPGETREIP